MKIAVIGTGHVGRTLGSRWAERGHEVTFGSRDPNKKSGELRGRVTSNADAAKDADVIALCTPWPATQAAIRQLGSLNGKVILDCTNPLTSDISDLDTGGAHSAGELVGKWAAGAKVVKIFNTVGYNIMADPKFPDGAASMCFAGDDAGAKKIAAQLASDLGFDPVDVGRLSLAASLERFALMWIQMAYDGHGREIAFKLMKR